MMSILDLSHGRYINVNDAWVAGMGYSHTEALGKTPLELNLYEDTNSRGVILNLLRGRAGTAVKKREQSHIYPHQ